MAVTGERASVNAEDAEAFNIQQIFNVDGNGLTWKRMPLLKDNFLGTRSQRIATHC